MLWEETAENYCFVHFELHRMYSKAQNSILQASIFVDNSTKYLIRKVYLSGPIYRFSAFDMLSHCIKKKVLNVDEALYNNLIHLEWD